MLPYPGCVLCPPSLAGITVLRLRHAQLGAAMARLFWRVPLLAKALKPSDDQLYVEGAESILVSASRAMAELTLEAARLVLGDDPEFRWRRDGVEHVRTRTRCRVLSSDSRRAYGLGASS